MFVYLNGVPPLLSAGGTGPIPISPVLHLSPVRPPPPPLSSCPKEPRWRLEPARARIFDRISQIRQI